MEQSERTIRDLQRVIRDLVSLATIPASWVGRESDHLVKSAASLVLHTLRVDASCVCIASPLQPLSAENASTHPGFISAVLDWQAGRLPSNSPAVTTLTRGDWPTPLRVIIQPIDISGDSGFIAAGSASMAFPSETDSLLLSLTANQLSVAFHTARLLADHQASEQAVRESEHRFRMITDASPIMVWMSGTDKLCFYFNKGWLDFVGRTLEQEVGNGWADNVHPDDFARCLEIYTTHFDARSSFEMEYRLKHRSGQYRWIVDRGVPRYSPDGIFEGYVGGCLDIHAQREAAEVRQRLAAIVESSEDAIVGKDLSGIVTSWNRGAEAIFGHRAEEMIGRSILKIIPPELHADESRILQTISRGERIQHFETIRLTKDGRRIDVSLTVSPVRDDAGRIVGAAKIARDISQKKETESALRTTERLAAVGRLAATVAHEINNPLEAVTNLVYLARSAAVRPDVREFLVSAEEELERVAQLTRQTLGFYRETKGVATINVGNAVTSFLPVFSSRARNKDVTLNTDIRTHVAIEAVPGEIRQVIGNLVANSIDAVAPGGRIMIRVSGAQRGGNDGIRLTVSDDGHGIPAHVRSQLFQPFFTTKRDVGTGLGLWVCKSIVEKHGGAIRLRTNTAPGRSGTAVSVFLPCRASGLVEDSLKQAV
jgi:PAS domain S-box-containing protein